VDERLGIPENHAMKLLISTFFTLLLLGFAGGAYGQTVETINYVDGSVYVGEFKYNLRNGQGTFTDANGSVYVGEFKDDQRNGQGTYTNKDKVRNGIWLNGAIIVTNNIPPVREAPSLVSSASNPSLQKKLQEQCLSFGFREGTDDMANCILQLYLKKDSGSQIADTQKIIEVQREANERQARQLAEQQRQQQEYQRAQVRMQQANLAEQKRQREAEDRKNAARALYKLGMDMANPGRGKKTSTCTRFGDFDNQIMTFEGSECPFGYLPAP